MIRRKSRNISALIFGLFLLCMAAPSYAACTNPAMPEGAIIYNEDQNVPQVCAGSTWIALGGLNPGAGGGSCTSPAMIEGAIVYNVDFGVLQYCDGANWIAVQAAQIGCTVPSDCSTIGDVCGDGTKFAGHTVDTDGSCRNLFLATVSSGGVQWSANGEQTLDTGADDLYDGRVNQAWVVANKTLSDYGAFEDCENLSNQGHTDWYLPSYSELTGMLAHASALGMGSNDYWASTESANNKAWCIGTGGGGCNSSNSVTKNTWMDSLCIRNVP